jgi:signal transduction histidine kinase
LFVVARNQAAVDMLVPGSGMAGILESHVPSDSTQTWSEKLKATLRKGQVARFDCVPYVGRGAVRSFLNIAVVPLTHGDGLPPIGGLFVGRDVGELVELEHGRSTTAPSAALDTPAMRLAHELNNTLDGVIRYINLAVRSLPEQGGGVNQVAEHLRDAERGLRRMVQVVRDLPGHAAGESFTSRTCLNRIVEEALRSMQDRAAQLGVIFAAGYHDENMPEYEGPALFQICSNIIKNALDAMPEGGRLTVTTGVAGEDVVLRFEDTGVGLPDDVEKIFEPFYTTKGERGTGLGLAICRDLVHRLGGRITAQPHRDGGSIITVRLPHNRRPPVDASLPTQPESFNGDGTA